MGHSKVNTTAKNIITNFLGNMNKPTQEQLNKWYAHKSNKEAWIEHQEYLAEQKEQEEEQLELIKMEEK